jgi:lipoyl(octanoyl) transferase
VDYEPTWREMQRITDTRDATTPDEIWLLEHPPVFTLGLNADPGHVLAAGDIPVVKIDRGGQVTYHGPGQLVVYPLIDIRRAGLGVRNRSPPSNAPSSTTARASTSGPSAARTHRGSMSTAAKSPVSACESPRCRCRPRIQCEHGTRAFQRINPCGYAGLQMTQLAELGRPAPAWSKPGAFVHLLRALGAASETLIGAATPGRGRELFEFSTVRTLCLLALHAPLPAEEAAASDMVVIDLRPKEERKDSARGTGRQMQQGCIPHSRRGLGSAQGRDTQGRSLTDDDRRHRRQDAHGAELVGLLQQADAGRWWRHARQRRHPKLFGPWQKKEKHPGSKCSRKESAGGWYEERKPRLCPHLGVRRDLRRQAVERAHRLLTPRKIDGSSTVRLPMEALLGARARTSGRWR